MVEMLEASAAVVRIAELITKFSGSFPFGVGEESPKKVNIREEQLILLNSLTAAGIDPHLFDLMLSSELDRNLKKQFGAAFLIATIFFTLLSYGVIVFNSVLNWGISTIAITALIVETPIQFIGLLYIIARNLFPQQSLAHHMVAQKVGRAPVPRVPRTPRPPAEDRNPPSLEPSS